MGIQFGHICATSYYFHPIRSHAVAVVGIVVVQVTCRIDVTNIVTVASVRSTQPEGRNSTELLTTTTPYKLLFNRTHITSFVGLTPILYFALQAADLFSDIFNSFALD